MMRFKRTVLVALVVVIGASPLSAGAGSRITAEKLGASFTLPDGFELGASVTAAAGNSGPMNFNRGQVGGDSFAVLQFAPLGGTIGPGKIDRKILEDAARAASRAGGADITAFEYRTARWKTFDLELVVARVSNQGRRLVSLSTQVPLTRSALNISLMGPAGEEARLATEVQATLSSLEGQTNWLTDEQRSERLGRVVGMVFGALVGGGVVLFIALRRKRQKSSPG